MEVKINKRQLIINIIAVALVLLVTAFIGLKFINTDRTVAAAENQIEIRVNKVTTVTIYVFGSGVELVSSTSNYDIYTAEISSTVRLQAVNETRMFTGWVISKQDGSAKTDLPVIDEEQNIVNFTVSETMANLDITVNRKNATADDYGKYMMDRFVIVDESELIALQDILAGSNKNEDFAKFFKDPLTYDSDEEKVLRRKELQNGYFLIANNFTVFNDKFKGIGTEEVPFQGVMCGKNGNNSKLFITITDEEKEGTSYYGLFGYLGEKSVIRNLIVSTSIGITPSTVLGNNTIYAGGLAGVIDRSTLVDVVVSASMGINSESAKYIYAGGIAGSTLSGTGIDSISDVVYDGTDSKWSITSSQEDSIISAGLIVGLAIDTYIKEVDIKVTNQLVDIKNDSVNDKYTNSKLYLGNVFGKYVALNNNKTIDNIMIMGDNGENLRAMTTNGDAIVGGLIGYVEANGEKTLSLGKTYFRVIGVNKSKYEASTISTNNIGNVYAGGIFGYVEGENVIALDEFKNRLESIQVDEDTSAIEANYLFRGDYQISAIQNGKPHVVNNNGIVISGGKAIAGGIVGKGQILIDGGDIQTNVTNLALCREDSTLLIEAIQSKLTTRVENINYNDKEHACAALIFGSVGNESVNMRNINVYSNNTTVQTIREIGTTGIGDLHTGGFISYANNSTFSDINLYLNECKLLAESLSYEGQNPNEDTNSAFCGGFAGELLGGSSLTNFIFGGYDTRTFDKDTHNRVFVGTTSYLESIQNTIPGGGDYRGENYIGGVVGRIQRVDLTNCKFIGSGSSKDYIRMSGHESPDSAFCGGIVGLIRANTSNVESNVINCEVVNAEITGNATNVKNYSNPDIYVGGIIGAAYIHNTTDVITVENCNLKDSEVYALGNEKIATYAGGIIAGATWQSQININDCYVTNSGIKANMTVTVSNPGDLEASAGGIIGLKGDGTTTIINNCVVIDTEVNAAVESTDAGLDAYAAGIAGFTENAKTVTIGNCYSNANVSAKHSTTPSSAYAYGLAYKATLTNSSKEVSTIIDAETFIDFTHNGYVFNVVNAAEGTYSITLNGNPVTLYYSTTFRLLDDGRMLIGTNRYVTFNNSGVIGYGRTGGYNFYDALDKENIKPSTPTYGVATVNCYYSYYIARNVKNPATSQVGTALGAGPFEIPLSTQENPVITNPYVTYNYLKGFDGVSQKLYVEIIGDANGFGTNNLKDQTLNITATQENKMVLAHIWINAKENGGTLETKNGEEVIIAPSHDDKQLAAKDGWFILDYVLLYNGTLSEINSDFKHDAEGNVILDITYTDGKSEYEYHRNESAEEGQKDYIENINDSTDKIYNNYAEKPVVTVEDNNGDESNKIKEFTFKVYDDMLYLNVDFEIYHFGANYKLMFIQSDQTTIIEDADFREQYGQIELKLTEKHSSKVEVEDDLGNVISTTFYDRYNLTYKPNENIETDATFYILFVGGNQLNSTETIFKVNLEANELELDGAIYADYTPPLNYFEDGIGQSEDNPYKLYVGSITKFIPVFTKSNDLVAGTKHTLEEYIEKCTYTINITNPNGNAENNFSIKTNGELTASNISGQKGTLTITPKAKGLASFTIHFISVDDKKVSYSSDGADIEGLTHASSQVDFYFEQTIRANYSGKPDLFTINIGNTTHDLKDSPNAVTGISVYELDENGNIIGDALTAYNQDAKGYAVIVNKDLLTANTINVNLEYPIIYTISFQLQCERFNGGYGEFTKEYKIVGGTPFNEYFDENKENEIKDWILNAHVFGYTFTGFYLVNDASSISSYGISFEKLVSSNYIVNSSNTFYGRWSYLIELIEAPGTYIKTGFNSAFMQSYEEDDFTREIQIPINNNQGYVFRVDKDASYVGEVDVEAYVITKDGENKVKTPVDIHYYQGNKNLYFIEPEDITGYLVITTNVGNSDLIVGEHTSSVTEDVTPEDGIITFKYIVNHFNDGNSSSYIYNLVDEDGNKIDYTDLQKEFVLDFYKQSTHTDLKLPDFTEIRVYYNSYINGSDTPSNTIVGTYITHNDDRVYLTEFKLLDLETDAFPENRTFGESLGTSQKMTEVYYFTITPPNGYTEKVNNEIANYVVECGYCYGKAANHGEIEYLEGVRKINEASKDSENPLNLANPNDLKDVINITTNLESSRQDKVYHVTPTRNTRLEWVEGVPYRFTDDTTYSVYDIKLTDTQKLPDFNYISLYDYGQNSILESGLMNFGIKELRLTLGYRLGKVNIYGMIDEETGWTEEPIAVIDVTSAVYQEYVVNFPMGDDPNNKYPYRAFKIDNVSTNEIRVSQIDVQSGSNDVVYEGPISHLEEKSVDSENNTYTYSLVNQIVGDSRHDGKQFVLSIQLQSTNNSQLIEDMAGDVYIKISNAGLPDVAHYVYLNEYSGKGIAYINLSSILKVLNVKTIDFDIFVPNDTQIYEVRLLEVANEFKPSQGEARFIYEHLHKHNYVDGVCSDCGHIDVDYHPEVNNPIKDTVELVAYDNTAFVSGGFEPVNSNAGTHTVNGIKVTNSINVNYFCDRDVLDSNSLIYQNKILLEKVSDNIYKIIDVVNNNNNSVKNRSDWTHAIATVYSDNSVDFSWYTKKYSEYISTSEQSFYVVLDGSLIHTSQNKDNTYFYENIYDNARLGLWNNYVNANIYQYSTIPNEVAIYYDLNGGDSWNTNAPSETYGDLYVSKVAKDSSFTLPTPKRSGYRFLGWYEVGEQVGDTISARDCLLVARWEKTSIPDGALEVGVGKQYTTIQSAINAATAGDVIYVHPGTYAEALTINKQVAILGPNMDIEGNGNRLEEAIIIGTKETTVVDTSITTITAVGVELRGLKFTKAIKIGANNTTITNCRIEPTNTAKCFNNNRQGCIADSKAISNLTISNSYIEAPGTIQSYTTQIFSFTNITNFTLQGNYITNKNHVKEELYNGTPSHYEGMRIYTCGGIINILNNEFRFSTTAYLINMGVNANSCTEINIVDNIIDKSGNVAVDMQETAGICIQKGSANLTTKIIGNEIYNCCGSTYSFPDDVNSKLEVKYNYYGTGTSYKIINNPKGTKVYSNNYYVEAQTTSTVSIETGEHILYTGGLEQYKADYAEYKASLQQ